MWLNVAKYKFLLINEICLLIEMYWFTAELSVVIFMGYYMLQSFKMIQFRDVKFTGSVEVLWSLKDWFSFWKLVFFGGGEGSKIL